MLGKTLSVWCWCVRRLRTATIVRSVGADVYRSARALLVMQVQQDCADRCVLLAIERDELEAKWLAAQEQVRELRAARVDWVRAVRARQRSDE